MNLPLPAHRGHWASRLGSSHERIGWRQDIREGRFQKHLAAATVVSAFFSGFEALYSHYKNNFRFAAQWSPIVIAPALMAAGAGLRQKPQSRPHTGCPLFRPSRFSTAASASSITRAAC